MELNTIFKSRNSCSDVQSKTALQSNCDRICSRVIIHFFE